MENQRIFAIVLDYGWRVEQASFSGENWEIFQAYDLSKFDEAKWEVIHDKKEQQAKRKEYESKGWKVVTVSLWA